MGRLILLLILFVPLAALPAAGADDDVRNWEQLILERHTSVQDCTTPSGGVPITGMAGWHDWNATRAVYWIEVDIHATLQSGVTVRTIEWHATLKNENTSAVLETFSRNTIGASADQRSAYLESHSKAATTFLDADHTYRAWVNRSTVTGSDPVTWCQVDITFHALESVQMEFDVNLLSTFKSLFGVSAVEFTFILAAAITGIILWSRSTDEGVRFFGGFLVILQGLLYLAIALHNGIGNVWAGTIPIAAMFWITGAYLLIRWGIDLFGSRA